MSACSVVSYWKPKNRSSLRRHNSSKFSSLAKKPRILAVLDKPNMRFDGRGGPRVKIFELADSKVPSPAFSVEFFQLFSIFFHFSMNWGAKFFSRMVPKFYCIFMFIFPRASLLRLRSMAHFHYPRLEMDLKFWPSTERATILH